MRGFASDNWAGAHPEVLAAIAAANDGHAHAYGDDELTERACARIAELVGGAAHVALTFNGTGANVVGLQAMTRPHNAVLCAEGAHIDVDECGAPERFAGCKLLTVADAARQAHAGAVAARPRSAVGDEHRVQPRVLSISQATELGHRLHAGRGARAGRRRARAGMLAAHGRRAAGQRRRVAGRAAARVHRRRAASTCSPSASPRTARCSARRSSCFDRGVGARPRASSASRAMQLASKMRFVAAQVAGAARRRPLAAQRAGTRTRWRARLADGLAAIDGIDDRPPGAGQRGLRHPAAGARRAAAGASRRSTSGTRRRRGAPGCARSTRTEEDVDAFVAAARDLAARYVA